MDLEQDGPPEHPRDLSAIPDAVPRVEPPCEYGNPGVYEVDNQRYMVMHNSRGYVQRGLASWYGIKFHNRYTSCREPYDMYAMTAAHRTLPLPTYVRVTNLDNGRSTVVRVNDRGPFRNNRIIDLSYTAAYKLGALGPGTIPVEVRAIDPRAPGEAYGLTKTFAAPAETSSPLELSRAATIYLQMGAFAERQNAERLRAQLEQRGIESVHVLPVVQPIHVQNAGRDDFGAVLYRVRVGPLADRAAAARMEQDLSYMGLGRPHVVP